MAALSILVVGGGLTGAAVCRALRRQLPAESLCVWEALGAVGGRMHTECVVADGCGPHGRADTGAQYITVTDEAAVAAAHRPLYDLLLDAGVLRPLAGRIEGTRAADGGGTNLVAPAGVASIIEHLFSAAGVAPACGRRAVSLRRVVAARDAAADGGAPLPLVRGGGRWEVCAADGHRQRFDAVVLTQPIPEMLELLDTGEGGAWLDGGDGVGRAELSAVQYSSRYALTLFFPPVAREAFAANIDWVSRYVDKAEDDAIVYVAHDSAKRGDAAGAVSLVVHTGVPYGIRAMLKSRTPAADVEADLRARVQALLPWLPAPASTVLTPWRVSQVRYPVALPTGAACLPLRPPPAAAPAAASDEEEAPALVVAGDAFSPLGSRFDGCVQSGERAAEAVLAAVGAGEGA